MNDTDDEIFDEDLPEDLLYYLMYDDGCAVEPADPYDVGYETGVNAAKNNIKISTIKSPYKINSVDFEEWFDGLRHGEGDAMFDHTSEFFINEEND